MDLKDTKETDLSSLTWGSEREGEVQDDLQLLSWAMEGDDFQGQRAHIYQAYTLLPGIYLGWYGVI